MEIFVARQPIFDDRERVVGYELLHRDGAAAQVVTTDAVAATSRLLSDHVLVEAGSQLTAGHPAWVRFPTAMLLDGSPLLVPAHRLVVELNTRDVDDDIMAACAMLSDYGYVIAVGPVGDVTVDDRLPDVADVIRVDFRATQGVARRELAARLAGRTRLLASHVETRDDQSEAVALGFELLQGSFLSQPVTMTRRTVDRTRLGVLAAMDAVARDPIDFAEVERAIKSDVALTDRLLRYINSAAFAWRDRITAIQQALVTMGERDVRRWVTVNSLVTVSQSSNQQLLVSALFRAHMCERLAGLLPSDVSQFDLFLTGMYSRVPLLIGADLATTVNLVPLSDQVRNALLEHEGMLWEALQLVIAWEHGAWDDVASGCDELGIEPEELSDCYSRAVNFADTVTDESAVPASAHAGR